MNAPELIRYHRPHRRTRDGSQWAWYDGHCFNAMRATLPPDVYNAVAESAGDIGSSETLFDSEGDAMAALCVALFALTNKGAA